jgi:hypothetical protein
MKGCANALWWLWMGWNLGEESSGVQAGEIF